MLRKKVFIILTFIVSFSLFVNISYASNNGVVYLTSEQGVVNLEEEIDITVNLKNSKVAACNFNIYFDKEKVEFISILNQENAMTNIIENRVSFVWFDKFGGEGAKEGEISVFKFKAKDKGETTFTIDGEFYNEYVQLIETSFEEIKLQIGKEESEFQEQVLEKQSTNNQNANLEVLAIENTLLYPPFDATHTDYEVEVSNDTESLNLFAVPENENASVEVNGKNNLKEGENLVTVIVKEQDGLKTKIYNIKVIKRNLDEEKKFEEQQEHKKEELENAYKIQKTSSIIDSREVQIDNNQDKNNKTVAIVVVCIATLVLIVFVEIWKIRKKHR